MNVTPNLSCRLISSNWVFQQLYRVPSGSSSSSSLGPSSERASATRWRWLPDN